MKNNYFIKKPKKGWIVFLVLIFGLFVNEAMGQAIFTWTGNTSNDWATSTNWTKSGTATADGYPGQANQTNYVVINKNDTPYPPIIASGTYGVSRITINNAFGTSSGATLTINSGAVLNVVGTTISNVILNGGNIINDGTLNIATTAPGSSTFLTSGFSCGTPTVPPPAAPADPTVYGYTGGANSILNIDISGAVYLGAAAVAVTGVNANTTYQMLFNGTTTISLGTALTYVNTVPDPDVTQPTNFFAFRIAGGANASKLIVGGTGFTIGSVASKIVNGGLFSLGAQSTVTVNSGTTLTLHSSNTNVTRGIASFSASNVATNFNNKGTINILGASTTSGVSLTIDNTGNSNFSPTVKVINFENQGTLNVDMAVSAASEAPFSVGLAGLGQGNINVKNTTTGIMNLKNNQPSAASIGSAIFVASGGNVANVNFTNNGNLNLTGNNVVNGSNGGSVAIPRSSIINTGTLTSNNNINSWVVSNSATGIISFVSPAGTTASAVPFNGAFGTNNGIIKTASGSTIHNNLRDIAGYSATSTIEPGGAGYGVADLGIIGATAPAGTLKLQVAGNVAGVDYDQLKIATGGVGYTSVPTVSFAGGAGSGASGYVTVSAGVITGVTMVSGGSGYTNGSPVSFSVGVGQAGTAVVSGGAITGVTLSGTKTTNYTANSNITFASAITTAATATATLSGGTTGFVNAISFTGGTGYTSVPTVSFSASGSTTSAAVTATISGGAVTGFNTVLSLSSLNLDIPFLYTPTVSTTIPIVTLSGLGATITGSFANVTGLKAGWALEYLATVVNLKYTTGTTTPNTWTGTNSSDWTDAGNWSAGVPTVSNDVTIPTASSNQPVIGSNVDINSLVIESGKSLTANTGFNLAVTGIITNNGTLTINNNANLIQVDNVTNTGSGTTTVKRDSNALSRLDFTSWSSPVTNASQYLSTFSPSTSLNRFYDYDEANSQYTVIASPTTTPFATATGYLIRVPFAHPLTPTVWTEGSFSGVPNNGTITKAITYLNATHGYNMIGNPYPSTIDAEAFITANTANIESSLYFWRKTNAASGSSYAIYNPMGGTIASPSSEIPNGTIQVGQGFFVKAKSTSSVTFTNEMRVANNDDQFFKTKQVQKDRVWLNLTTVSGAFSQALIGYTADATSGVDMYDAKYINDSPIALTSNINDEEYSIQGRPSFDATDVVALNFKTNVEGDYTIALDQFDGVFATGQDVYLADSKTGAETDLKTGSYTFNAEVGTDNTRFSLKYQKSLKVAAPAFDDNSISVYASNGTIYVNSKSVAISNIKVFDVQGRLLAEQNNVKATTAVISNLRAGNQVLIVKISGEDNREVTKKLLN